MVRKSMFATVPDMPEVVGIPKASAAYLHENLDYRSLRGWDVKRLRESGASEAFILGFIAGCDFARDVVERMEQADLHNSED